MGLNLLIETGIVHCGTLTFSASIYVLLGMFDAIESDKLINPKLFARKVLGLQNDMPCPNNHLNPANTIVSVSEYNTALVASLESRNFKLYENGLNMGSNFDI